MKIEIKKFSFGGAILAAVAHFIITVFIGLCALSSALGASPTHNPTAAIKVAEGIFWILDTGPMIAYRYFGITFEKGLYVIAFSWSILIGVILGIIIPLMKNKGAS